MRSTLEMSPSSVKIEKPNLARQRAVANCPTFPFLFACKATPPCDDRAADQSESFLLITQSTALSPASWPVAGLSGCPSIQGNSAPRVTARALQLKSVALPTELRLHHGYCYGVVQSGQG